MKISEKGTYNFNTLAPRLFPKRSHSFPQLPSECVYHGIKSFKVPRDLFQVVMGSCWRRNGRLRRGSSSLTISFKSFSSTETPQRAPLQFSLPRAISLNCLTSEKECYSNSLSKLKLTQKKDGGGERKTAPSAGTDFRASKLGRCVHFMTF